MPMLWSVVRVLLIAVIVVAVGEVSKRSPRYGALLLSLPIVSVLALVVGWLQHHDLPSLSKLSRETIVLVLLGLPLFVPLAVADRWRLNFWSALVMGIAFAAFSVGAWLTFTRTSS